MTENELQEICCSICERANVDYLHVPNESGTANQRALGMRRGVPDLLLVGNSVMFVELKRNERLKASEFQEDMMLAMKRCGVPVKLVGSERQFRTTLRQVTKERNASRVGFPMGLSEYKQFGSPMQRVSRFYLDKQQKYQTNELFAIKLFSNQNRKFPWLCNIKEHYFVATQTSTVTSKLLLAGWDVLFI